MLVNRLSAILLAIFFSACASTAPEVPAPAPMPPAEEPAPPPEEEAEPPLDVIEEARPDEWFHLDPATDDYPDISTDQAYAALQQMNREPGRVIVVAVIDSGVDIEHEDLQGRIWENEDEVAGNGIDDDNNGYIDDVNGWNFIGNPNGENVDIDTYEVARELARLQPLYENADTTLLSDAAREEYAYYQEIVAAHAAEVAELEEIIINYGEAASTLEIVNELMIQALGKFIVTEEDVKAFEPPDEQMQQVKDIWLYFNSLGVDVAFFKEEAEGLKITLEKSLDPSFDPRPIVGDDYANVNETGYGNNDVEGPDAFHGTFVSGIIAAGRDNGVGMDGITNHVRIMSLRAVPDGDERDKDVANAIRYAADNGAHIINMSFGKGFSPQKAAVDAAVKHAESKGVLMVHAAGNDAEDNDAITHFPVRRFEDGGQSSLWMEVGASNYEEESLAASFSNYGAIDVEVFAPGVQVYSTDVDNEYKAADGTSFAAPVVSGIAAMLMAYYPSLSAEQVRSIIIESVVSYEDDQVIMPGTESDLVRFGNLSVTGGVVNAYQAVQRAEEMVGQ